MITILSLGLAKLPMPVFAAVCPTHHFFFLPTWWEYLKTTTDAAGQCAVQFSSPFSYSDVFAVGLAVLDILLRIAAFVAVASIIYAGINYMTTMGNPEKASAARHRIYDSLIGLAFVFMATALVTFLGNAIATK